MTYRITLSFGMLFLLFNPLFPQPNLDILPKWRIYPDARNALIYHLNEQAIHQLDERAEKVANISTPDGWEAYQKQIRRALHEAVGPFPKKTPLQPQVLRRIEKPSYTIEHLVFESRPDYFVTASLFLPARVDEGEPLPAILYCSGHSALGYRSDTYQHVILNLVSKGFIVLAFDPIGQGERIQYLDQQTGQSAVGGPTKEHSWPGAQHFLTGSDVTPYMIWDGIRAVDYLISRSEVDPERIGITGRSGGGTQSAHIAAFDERIHAAAPENFITNTKRLLQTRGPQDAEQFFRGEIARGLDHPDLLLARAPKPTQIITTTNDIFSIQGSRETEQEVARAYAALGKPGNFTRVEDLAGHASTRKNREAMYAFFQEHLGNPGSPEDEDVEIPTPEELRVTPSGQLYTSLNGETLFSLNLQRSKHLADSLRTARTEDPRHLENAIASAKALSGFEEPKRSEKVIYAGRIGRPEYVIDQFILPGEGKYPIPCLLVTPEKANGEVLIYLHENGKQALLEDSLSLMPLLGSGTTLLLPDLIGFGEMGPVTFGGDSGFDGVSYNAWFLGIYQARSPLGVRAGDLIRLVNFLDGQGFETVSAMATGNLSADLLHAAAFENRIDRVVLHNGLLSYWPVAETRMYDPHLVPHLVPGALRAYDLPDLAASLAPRELYIREQGESPRMGQISEADEAFIRSAYRSMGAEDKLQIKRDGK